MKKCRMRASVKFQQTDRESVGSSSSGISLPVICLKAGASMLKCKKKKKPLQHETERLIEGRADVFRNA